MTAPLKLSGRMKVVDIGDAQRAPAPSLWKVRLMDPIVRSGKVRQHAYVVLAVDGRDALDVLRTACPDAFQYNPAVVALEPHGATFAKVADIMVDRPKGGVHAPR